MELLSHIKDNKVVEKIKARIIESLNKCKDKLNELPDQEKTVLDELDKHKDLINDYINTVDHLDKIKNIINSKEAL